jgi:hypothetical protein
VLAADYKSVSITEGGEQFISVPANMEVIYLYTSDVPENGGLVLSFPDNDTYMVKSENSIKMITVNKKNYSIIETILVWLGL